MRLKLLAPLGLLALITGCIAPTGPIEVTRFHVPDTSMLAKGTIAIEAPVTQARGREKA